MKRTIAIALFAAAILASGCTDKIENTATNPVDHAPVALNEPPEQLGDWADFKFTTTAGKTVSLADYKGKTLLVDVWSYT